VGSYSSETRFVRCCFSLRSRILLALGITCGKTIGCRAFGLFLYVDLGIATAKIGLIFASRRTINAVKIKCFGFVLARLEKLRSLPFDGRYVGELLCPHRFQWQISIESLKKQAVTSQ
jgi:hypothetical protein